MKDNEHQEQVYYFQWVDIKATHDERYLNIYAIPNGGHRHIAVATKLKAEGVRAGVLDINIDWPSSGYNGLRIEMKYGKNKLSDNQKKWVSRYEKAGYKVNVCYSWIEAKEETENYLH